MPPFDWHQFRRDRQSKPPVIDPRRRLRICLGAFLAALGVIFGRMVQLEWTEGAGFREEAAKPPVRQQVVDAVRGRILAHDGTVLACDQAVQALAVHYRYLQAEPDPRWLRNTARSRLSRAHRKDPQLVAAEEAKVAAQRTDLARRLADACGVSPDQWARRAARIEARVRRIAQTVNARRGLTGDEPERIIVGEELDHHVMVEDVSRAVVAEIEADPQRYPGVKIVPIRRRTYPHGPLACHVLGHLGPGAMPGAMPSRSVGMNANGHGDASDPAPPSRVGRMGVERRYESVLAGQRDVVLTLDPKLQATAESLLEDALRRRAIGRPNAKPSGGAIVVMDCQSGAILAAASAPRFDPNQFAGIDGDEVAALLDDPGHPLFDRVARMAIPPGSVFKTVAAVALLEAAAVQPEAAADCRGYLHSPDQWRCAIYRRQGIGHGEVALADALAQSCNVYFFLHAARLRPADMADWASRFGFGQPTGVDLPAEAPGTLPAPAMLRDRTGREWTAADTQLAAIGQGPLEVTPLQVARMMAAVANGGKLVTPHVAARPGPLPQPIPGLHPATLGAIREGLKRTVCDPKGTGYGTVRLESIAISGKTGTAETGDEGDHAWFAGYAPAENPKIVLVVALEHAGDGAEAAGPVAKRLVMRLEQLGYVGGSRR